MPVTLLLSSGKRRVVEAADGARMEDGFFMVTKSRPFLEGEDTLLTLRSVEVVSAEVTTGGDTRFIAGGAGSAKT